MPYAEWLEWCRKGIGGSDSSVICGINQYKSPIELWLEKTGQMPYQEAGEAAYWGTQLESLVRAEFTKRTGIEVIELDAILQHDEHEFMFANLDGLCNCPTHGKCVFEAKTASAYKLADWEDKIPDEYMLQIQHYIAVTDCVGAYVAVLIGGNTFKWRYIPRDDEIISMLIQLEGDFWEHVQNNTPPPLDGSEATARFLGEKFSNSNDTRIALPATAEELIYQYAAADAKVCEFSEQKQLAENLLKNMLGENEIGDIGFHAVSWKSQSREQKEKKT
jgi:putative phage-type endonuclease